MVDERTVPESGEAGEKRRSVDVGDVPVGRISAGIGGK